MFGDLKIFSGNANIPLAESICKYAGVKLGNCTINKFSNENIKVRYNESLRGKDVFIIQPSCVPVNEGIIELLIMIDAAKHASATRITAVLPYFPYVRSDKKDEPRISITARLMTDIIAIAGANRIMTMNLHSPQIQGFSRIPFDHLLAGKLICDFCKDIAKEDAVVVAPDAGSAKHAGRYAITLKLPLAILDKRRRDDTELPVIENIIGDVKGKKALIFDDEVATGGSLIKVAEALKDHGAKEIVACCVHGVLSGNAVKNIKDSDIEKLVITDTVFVPEEKKFDKLTIISVAELFGEAIKCTNEGNAISGLYYQF